MRVPEGEVNWLLLIGVYRYDQMWQLTHQCVKCPVVIHRMSAKKGQPTTAGYITANRWRS